MTEHPRFGRLRLGPLGPRWHRYGRALLSPLLNLGLVGCAIIWFVLYYHNPGLPSWVSWVVPLVSAATASAACLRVARSRALPRATRRFWAFLAADTTALIFGVVSRIREGPANPVGPSSPGLSRTLALFLLSVLLMLVALLQLPLRRQRRTELVRSALDAGTVVVTASVTTWYVFSRWDGSSSGVTVTTESRIGIYLLVIATVVVMVKVAFAGTGTIDSHAMQALGASTLAGVAAGFVPRMLGTRTYLSGLHLIVPACCFFILWGAHLQRGASRRAAVARGRRRQYSLLPYAGIAVMDVLLIASVHSAQLAMVVAIGSVVLTVLVAARQIVTLRDNELLLARLDTTVAELGASEDRLLYQVTHDPLTRLANRALFQKRVIEAIIAAEHPEDVAVILVDLDDFRIINDRLEHRVGDQLLVAVADRLTQCVGPAVVVGRLGGDEFVVLRDGTSAPVLDVVAAVLGMFEESFSAAGHELLVNATIGVADGRPGATVDDLLRGADLAMYAAKEQGKNRWARFDSEMDSRVVEHAQLAAEIRLGMDRGEFRLLYQPVVTLPAGDLVGVEALVRWQHPTRGLVAPDDFIPITERTGLIIPLGLWILRTACEQQVLWKQIYGSSAPGRMNVNVSARQLSKADFPDQVAKIVKETGVDPTTLVVEVTETAVFDGGAPVAALEALRALGIRIALDDFGTGHSSLALLRSCPIDVLKVDKSFVDGVTGSSEDSAIARFVIQITNGLQLEAVAEGVETASQAASLLALGYQLAQGYHFARPVRASEVEDIIIAARSAAKLAS